MNSSHTKEKPSKELPLFDKPKKLKRIRRAKGSQLGSLPTLPIPWISKNIFHYPDIAHYDDEKFCERFDCPFCGFHTNDVDFDRHLLECEEVPKLENQLGENMKLDSHVLQQQTLATHQFLKARNLAGGRAEATIVAFRVAEANMPFSDYLLDVKIGRTIFTQGLRERNEDFLRLCKKYGLDTDKWIGKTIVLYTEAYQSQAGKKSQIVRVSPK